MTKAKKYYWLKLKEDFFEDDTISWIEEQENGKDYCLFYLKLCLKSLKTDGLLIRNVGTMLVPYDVKQLSKITNTDTDTVRVAMELFKNIGLIEILENGEIYLNQLQNMVGSETKWAEKKRVQRQKKDNVPKLSGQCPIEIEQEKETEQELDLETEKEKDTEIQQETEIEKIVVDKVKLYFPNTTFKELNAIKNEFLKKNKDIYYLTEKLILTYENKRLEKKIGYLISAIRDDYELKENYPIDKILIAWEQELYEKPNNPIVQDRVMYYRYLNNEKFKNL